MDITGLSAVLIGFFVRLEARFSAPDPRYLDGGARRSGQGRALARP